MADDAGTRDAVWDDRGLDVYKRQHIDGLILCHSLSLFFERIKVQSFSGVTIKMWEKIPFPEF